MKKRYAFSAGLALVMALGLIMAACDTGSGAAEVPLESVEYRSLVGQDLYILKIFESAARAAYVPRVGDAYELWIAYGGAGQSVLASAGKVASMPGAGVSGAMVLRLTDDKGTALQATIVNARATSDGGEEIAQSVMAGLTGNLVPARGGAPIAVKGTVKPEAPAGVKITSIPPVISGGGNTGGAGGGNPGVAGNVTIKTPATADVNGEIELTVGDTTTTYTYQTDAAANFTFTKIANNTEAKVVKKDTAEPSGSLTIPAYYQDASGGFFPVTSIGALDDRRGRGAFSDCFSLVGVTIPTTVKVIGAVAFRSCTSLTAVTFDPGSALATIGDGAFSSTSLTSVTIPEGVTSIGGGAFSGTSLTSVTIPEGVTSIGGGAFSGTSLTSIAIPATVTAIGGGPFSSTGLTEITVAAGNTAFSVVDNVLYNKAGTTLVQYAPGKAGTSFTIPDTITSIGDDAFGGCTSLAEITVAAGNTAFSARDNVLYNKAETILIQYALGKAETSFTIPDSVTSIGDYAFSYCTSLTSLTIPASVTSIGSGAFAGWEASQTINIERYASEAAADAAWPWWRDGCNATIIYLGQ